MEQTQTIDTLQDTLDHWLTLARHTPLGVICDLDGTLLPFAPTPSQSALPPALVDLLNELAAMPGVQLAVVSGRLRDQLERIMAPVPDAWLVAEHGAWRRRGAAWESTVDMQDGDIEPLVETLSRLARSAEGALIERKTWSVTFHYRMVPPEKHDALVVEVDAIVDDWLEQNSGFERLDGAEVLEVRPVRVRKSLAVPWLLDQIGGGARLVVLGDDLTDEDMFRELGAFDEPVLVGRPRRSHARWRLEDPAAVARFLGWIVNVRHGEPDGLAPIPEPLVAQAHQLHRPAEPYELLVVSNRLPDISAVAESADEERKRNVGGLVSALEPVLRARNGLWLGWSGHTTTESEPGEINANTETDLTLAGIDFPYTWYRDYYNGFSNRTLWPLFHGFPHYVTFSDEDWECYRHVNRAFAAAAVELVGPDTPVWLHDYHLLMTAHELRELGHRGPIGLFLHIPFPAPDLFGILPWAEQLLDGMLDLDLIGFHTARDVDNFRHTVGAYSPARVSDDSVEHRGRRIHVRAFPLGIFADFFQEPARPEVMDEVADMLRAIAPSRLVLGVDRLDYTKGIPERLEAFGRLLEMYPQWRGQVSLVQISVPSREDVPEYIEQRRRIENIVGRINGQYGEAAWVPVRYLYRSYTPEQLAELYRAAAVGYVTPLRDGMNLVAKEYVAAQDPDDPGVLLLSRFAGAAAELKDAVLTNPWYKDGVARDLDRALRMDLAERQERHRRLLAVVSRTTPATWAEDFIDALTALQ